MPTVLVIEDEPDVRELIRLELSCEGFEAKTADDGPDGLAAAAREQPDVIVLDLMLPGIDGWEVLRRLKGDAELTDIPVVVLTACASDVDRARGGIEGAVRYLTKPFSPDELTVTLLDVLDGTPERVQRRLAQHQALSAIARMESPSTTVTPTLARPHLTRLDGERPAASGRLHPTMIKLDALGTLSSKQRDLLDAVASSPTVMEVADDLSVSRSNVYASLRRIARRLGVPSVPELIALARSGEFN